MYGSDVPPEYDLSKINTTIHILYGTNDRIALADVSNCTNVFCVEHFN